MPQAVAAIGAAIIGGTSITGTLAAGFTVSFSWAAAALVGTVTLAVGFVTQALTPKPKSAADAAALPDISRDRTLAIRQPIVTGKLHVGRLRLSGAQTLIESTGSNNGKLHLLITLSVRPLGRLDELWINDEQVPLDWAFGAGIGGNATGKYAGKVKVWFGRGTTAGDSALNTALTAALGDTWTADHKQDGCGKLYAQLDWDESLFGGGTPNVSCVARAADLHDPRDDSDGWTDNWALAVAYYLTLAQNLGGFGAAWAEIDDDALIAAANASDEMVAVAEKSTTFTADAASDTLTLEDGTARLRTGMRVRLTTTGTLPGGLATGTDYYVCETGTLVLGLSTTLANARARTLIALTDAGTGTHTIVAKAEPRYTANGSIDTADEPDAILGKLLSGGAGKLIRVQGKWEIKAGVWAAPTRAALTMDDLVQGFSVAWRREPREAFNGVKGTFVDPDSAWQPTDFPAVAVAAYLTEDQNIRAWRANAELPFTISPSTAQRIARIELERNRRQISTKWGCKLTALDIAAGDVVPLTYPRYGWSEKYFEVGSFKLTTIEAEGATAAMVELGLAEIDENVFAWDPADEIDLPPSPRTNLPSPGAVAPPTALTLSSGSGELDARIDGTIFSRLRLDWVAPADAFVTGGGLIEIQYKKSADADWQPSEFARGDATFYRILDVADGVAYDVRIRARNYLGAVSPGWVTETNHVVIGKTADPADVTGFSASQNGTRVNFRCDQHPDKDLERIEIRRAPQGVVDFDAATRTANLLRGEALVSEVVPPGEWTFLAAAFDTSGNRSANVARFDLTIRNPNTIVRQALSAPDWPGTRTGLVLHPTGVLIPDSTLLAADMTDAELWDSFVHSPVATCRYEAPELDLGFDVGVDQPVRCFAAIQAVLGPAETGAPVATLELDTRDGAGSYDGFEPWSAGAVQGRYVKARVTLDPPAGVAYLAAFDPTIDAERRTEIVANVSVGAGGTPVTFAQRFFNPPVVTVQPTGTTARIGQPSAVAATGCTAHVFDAAGAGVSATADIIADGV